VAAIPLLDDAAGQDDVAAAVVKLNTLITAFNEFQAGTADQIYKKTSGTDFAFEACNSFLPTGVNLKISKVSTGTWNMQLDTEISVAHAIADFTKILTVFVRVRNDANTLYGDIFNNDTTGSPFSDEEVAITWDATNINITTITSGYYNNTDFNSTSFDRGDIIIIYEG
jgi:hypothetical protein